MQPVTAAEGQGDGPARLVELSSACVSLQDKEQGQGQAKEEGVY